MTAAIKRGVVVSRVTGMKSYEDEGFPICFSRSSHHVSHSVGGRLFQMPLRMFSMRRYHVAIRITVIQAAEEL